MYWRQPRCAPSILILFINMVLFDKKSPVKSDCHQFMFEGEEELQVVLLGLAAICVPVLLLGKPFAVMCMKKKPKPPVSNTKFDINYAMTQK